MADKIKLTNGKTYDIVTDGIYNIESVLKIRISTTKTLTEIDNDFSAEKNVKNIILQQNDGTELKIYKDYTVCKSIEVDKSSASVLIIMSVEDKLDKLEKQVNNLQDAFAEIMG